MIIHKVIERIQLQIYLQKYDKKLLTLSNLNPNIVLDLFFNERNLIFNHCNIVLQKHIHITENDITKMNLEIIKHQQNIENILSKYTI